MLNPHELQISSALAEARQELDAMLGRLAYLRGRVSAAVTSMSAARATRMPEVARNLSIAITEAEGAQLRVQNAVAIFARGDADAR